MSIDMLAGFTHERAGEAVAPHLLDKGHRGFGLIRGDDERNDSTAGLHS